MIVNIFIILLSRFTLRFLDIFVKIKNKLDKEYYKLIWDNKIRDIIRDFHFYYSVKKGDMSGIDLYFIIDVNVVIIINRVIDNLEIM